MKILHLTLKKKGFDLIAVGKKKQEFRECKPYWVKRLFHGMDNQPNEFDELHFRNGYSKNAPYMRIKCEGLMLTSKEQCNPLHNEKLTDMVIVIELGEILELKGRL